MWEKTKAVSRDGLNDGDGEPQNGSSEHVAYFNKKAKKKKKKTETLFSGTNYCICYPKVITNWKLRGRDPSR